MIPATLQELEVIRAELRTMVLKRAALAGVAGAVPVPGLDIVADVGLLADLIPSISRRFGLSAEQVDELDETTRLFVFEVARKAGAKLVGRVITREVLLAVLKRIGRREVSKQALRYVPLVGQVVSGAIGFAALRYLGNLHIDECYAVAKRVIEDREAAPVERPPKPPRKPTKTKRTTSAPRRRPSSKPPRKTSR